MKSKDQQIESKELGRQLAERCAELILEKKGSDIVILDVAELTDIARHFVICSCDNDVHVRAVADSLRDELSKEGVKAWRTEGWKGLNWVIVDYADVVVHVFYRETRSFYNLERLWADAVITRVGDEPETKSPETSENE